MGFLRNFLKGASLTTALFIFQACYGTGPDMPPREMVSLTVVSDKDGTPIKDVGIYTRVYNSSNKDWHLCGYTDAQGHGRVMLFGDTQGVEYVVEGVIEGEIPEFRFADDEGNYVVKDTVFADFPRDNIVIKLREAE